MQIDTLSIYNALKLKIQTEVEERKSKGRNVKLLTVLVGESAPQLSYVKIKQRVAAAIGVDFDFYNIPDVRDTEELLMQLEERIEQTGPTGIIIQQPLPAHIDVNAVYTRLKHLDIEGHTSSAKYIFPLVKATLIGLNYAMLTQTTPANMHIPEICVDYDIDELKEFLKDKNVVVAGNGITTGHKIAKSFDESAISYIQTNSKTVNADVIYKKADIIISGVGKNILNASNIKPGAVLINFGLHRNAQGVLIGDYVESEIASIASLYTCTPGGMGPLDVLCMYQNLVSNNG